MEALHIATGIVKKLVDNGYVAYFAGGWVRDYLMGHPSDDIDIATNAPPEIILKLFPRTLLIGLSFGIVIVIEKNIQFEVATFRKDIDYEDGRKPNQIELSTAEEDAIRRDFTINGMFYDPLKKIIHDFVEGKKDISGGVIRAIGDPTLRFKEDRLRMIRAVRFASRFGFSIDVETQEAIMANADTLFPAVAMERIYQEVFKMVKFQGVERAFLEMYRLGLLQVIFPSLKDMHLKEMKERINCLDQFPKDAEPIFYILQLFPQCSIEEVKELCRYLKLSNYELGLAELYVFMRNTIEIEKKVSVIDDNAWALYYANHDGEKCLNVLAAIQKNREDFIKHHQAQKERLKMHIKRIIDKSPLINAAYLKELGIAPGKQMGLLIKEGQRLSIINDLNSKEDVLVMLKKSSLWPS